ncbi:MAG: N-acetylmuramoyl-L-alanine amidase [Patescibacteria group bacterium]|nr:N-acetylmuramoyl-L-alanine amidase [Patescibacteria group bacterium]
MVVTSPSDKINKQETKETKQINKEISQNEISTQEKETRETPPPKETQKKQVTPKEKTSKTKIADFIKQKLVTWGYQDSSSRKIDTIIIHSSYDALGDEPYDLEGLLDEYKQYEVAAHYLIDRKGNVYQLVKDKDIAYHAGISSVPDGRMNVNFFSIGIELMNTKEDEYTAKQYKSIKKLVDYLKNKYTIKYVLGHDDIATGRKTDPWNFDWDKIK